jgi:hypothetical protein
VMQYASRAGNRLFSSSFSIPRAIGRSKLGPSFRTFGGGQIDSNSFSVRNALLEMAEVTGSVQPRVLPVLQASNLKQEHWMALFEGNRCVWDHTMVDWL